MSDEQKFILYGVDMLLEAFNKYPDSKSFTVKEIIKISNDVCRNIKESKLSDDDVAAEENKIEIYINCHTDLSKGNLKRILDRVTEETKDYPHAKIRVVIS